MGAQDLTGQLTAAVREAARTGTPLAITGGGTKSWYGGVPRGVPLEVRGHTGIVHYAPEELVLTARAGTPLQEIESALAEHRQMLAFEPPHFGAGATLGGTVACGLSGPRRPHAGAARDFVLGMSVVNGRAETLHFGGEVMKNVAGYDVSRLMTGALGTLGLILEVSIKVWPRPARETTLVQELDAAQALAAMNRWAAAPVPLSAACWDDSRLYLRLSGAASAVAAAETRIGGAPHAEGEAFWADLREHRLRFFAGSGALWRVAVPPATPLADLPGRWLLDWGGAQRWYLGGDDADRVRRGAGAAGGHATLYRGGGREDGVFQPLPAGLALLQRHIKDAFDPAGIFNPGRLYPQW